jgi:hypothetical protein
VIFFFGLSSVPSGTSTAFDGLGRVSSNQVCEWRSPLTNEPQMQNVVSWNSALQLHGGGLVSLDIIVPKTAYSVRNDNSLVVRQTLCRSPTRGYFWRLPGTHIMRT